MYSGLSANRGFLFAKKNWFVLLMIGVYLFSTLYYMGPSLTNCQSVTYGFGDNTAGPIWRAMLPEKQGLLGGETAQTNAPYGDNLYSPVGVSLILQTVYIKALQAVAGPVCGYNLVNIIGFMSSALLMCGLVYVLTRNKWVAGFAGFAVSFTPYYQMKVGGHPSYGYQSIFIAIIWLFYRLIQYRRKRDSLFLALVFALAVYFDPYFTLYASLIMLALAGAWGVVNYKNVMDLFRLKHEKISLQFKAELRALLLAFGLIIALLIPLVVVYGVQSSQITSTVAAARGNTLAEAKACSNYPLEYATPFILSPLFERVFGADQYHNFISAVRGGLTCGIGEDTVGLSLTLMALAGAASIIWVWERVNGRRAGLGRSVRTYNPKVVILSIVFIGAVGLIISMPPVRFHGIPTPTYELLQITSTWRTLTRGYMLVNISLVALSSLIIAYCSRRFNKNRTILTVLFAIILLGVVIEYQAFKPFTGNKLSTFDYRKDVPSIYSWLKGQDKVNTIAEYPLEIEGRESDAGSYYLTMQSIHKKKLFNSALSTSPQEELRSGLKNLNDPQTLGVLKAFGVDAVVSHGVTQEKISQVKNATILYSAHQPRFNITSHTPTVKKDEGVIVGLSAIKPAESVIMLGDGFARNATIINSVIDWKYEAISGSVMKISGIQNRKLVKNKSPVNVCFSAQMSVPEELSTLKVKVDDGPLQTLGNIHGETSNYKVQAMRTVQIFAENGHNMRVSDLGCYE